jgi:hypothetical protein
MREQPEASACGAGVVSRTFPEFGPSDTAEGKDTLQAAFKESWSIWYTDRWHSDFKNIFFFPPFAETADEMREQLDRRMAEAIPRLRAILGEAEAAAARLHAAGQQLRAS